VAVRIDAQRCVGCGCCTDMCRFGALELHDRAVVSEDFCSECGMCVDFCPALAISAD